MPISARKVDSILVNKLASREEAGNIVSILCRSKGER
jgi:hypothetical protein